MLFVIFVAKFAKKQQLKRIKAEEAAAAIRRSQNVTNGPVIFNVSLYNIQKRPEELLDAFGFSISDLSQAKSEIAQDISLRLIKDRDIYKNNGDVRDLVMFLELDGYTAGHEFDVLPEALRRVRLEIRSEIRCAKEKGD